MSAFLLWVHFKVEGIKASPTVLILICLFHFQPHSVQISTDMFPAIDSFELVFVVSTSFQLVSGVGFFGSK